MIVNLKKWIEVFIRVDISFLHKCLLLFDDFFRGRNGYHNPVKDMTVEYVTSGGYYSHTHAPVYQSTTVPL